jgi:hypothetical protein
MTGSAELAKDESTVGLNEAVSITEQQTLVRKWWKEVDPLLSNAVSTNSLADKLVELRIAYDATEARRVIAKLIGQGVRTFGYPDFLQFFARSMMKGAIQSLAVKVSGDLFEDMEDSEKIVAYKRALLMTGLKYFKYEVSPQDGLLTLTALKKLKGGQPESKLTE